MINDKAIKVVLTMQGASPSSSTEFQISLSDTGENFGNNDGPAVFFRHHTTDTNIYTLVYKKSNDCRLYAEKNFTSNSKENLIPQDSYDYKQKKFADYSSR